MRLLVDAYLCRAFAGGSFCVERPGGVRADVMLSRQDLLLLCFLLAAVGLLEASAQPALPRHAEQRPDEIDTAAVGRLMLDVEGLCFFQDNEFDGTVQKGYTLPGFRVSPRLAYAPRPDLRLEAGLHALVFDGANKYPNYAFHDIARWKGAQYQSGAHLLPFLRATARLSALTLVLGHLYGGEHHGLILPMYNPETLLSADPEAGAQLLVRTRRWRLDVWVDWQSYIFEADRHQEAFTLGLTQALRLGGEGEGGWRFSLPFQLLAQHRGGEQDLSSLNLGVQTLVNASLGLKARRRFARGFFHTLEAEAHLLGAYQQAGKLWPFTSGAGLWAGVAAERGRSWRLRAGVFHAARFAPLYGSPFFGTLSLKDGGGHFSRMTTLHWGAEYARPFGRDYAFGAKLEGWITAQGRLHRPDGTSQPPTWGNAFSFGLFVRFHPRFLLASPRR